MTLEKALELLKELSRGMSKPDMLDYQAAVNLSIEGLRFIQLSRQIPGAIVPAQFTGETPTGDSP